MIHINKSSLKYSIFFKSGKGSRVLRPKFENYFSNSNSITNIVTEISEAPLNRTKQFSASPVLSPYLSALTNLFFLLEWDRRKSYKYLGLDKIDQEDSFQSTDHISSFQYSSLLNIAYKIYYKQVTIRY